MSDGERMSEEATGAEEEAPGVVEQMTQYAQSDAHRSYFVKPGQPAAHERGVLFGGPWETYADGFAKHVRHQARALAMGGVPTHLRTLVPRFQGTFGEEQELLVAYQDLATASIAVYGAQINMVVPSGDLLPNLVRHRHYTLEQQKHINSKRVLYTVWERQVGVPRGDVMAFNSCGQCWVATNQAKDLLVAAGVTSPVMVHPLPFLPDDPHLELNGRTRRPGPVRFYHIGKWEHRKAHHELLGSFLTAVKPGEATLLFKTSADAPRFKNYPSGPPASLELWLDDAAVRGNGWSKENINRGVFVIDRRLGDDQMVELHRMGDVYLSLSRGEGFDMPAMDAKLAGNLMVYTASGGPQDFCGEFDQLVPTSGTIECDPFYNWPKEARYLDYNVAAAAPAIQRAMSLVTSGTRERGLDLAWFSAERVGQRMAADLDELGWRGDGA